MRPFLNLHPRPNAHALIARNCNSDQSFADYFKQYRAFHGFLSPKLEGESKATITTRGETRYDVKSKSTDKFVQYEESTVKVGPATLKFQRTLRVPDNAKNYLLPPVRFFLSFFFQSCPEVTLWTTSGPWYFPAPTCSEILKKFTRFH